MPNDFRFSRLLDPNTRRVAITFEGEPVTACEGDTVAAALLAAGIIQTRVTPVSGRPRGAFCLMGVCFDCLVEIDGEPNRQGCMVEVRDGMAVRRMRGARNVGTTTVDD